MGCRLLDTGALYRAVAHASLPQIGTWSALERPESVERVIAVARAIEVRFEWGASAPGGAAVSPDDSDRRYCSESVAENRVFVNGVEVTRELRTLEMDEGASRVSRIPAVREALLGLQRTLAAEGNTVVEGRDMGTVVFPQASFKFFLTARPEVRARRRYDELSAAGQQVELSSIVREIEQRDERDIRREVSPLRPAADAEIVDTSDLTFAQVVDLLEHRVANGRPN